MKWIWVIFSSLLVSQLQADVLSELAHCNSIAEPKERLVCFNDIAIKHAVPEASSVSSEQTMPTSTPSIVKQPSVKQSIAKQSIAKQPSAKQPSVKPSVEANSVLAISKQPGTTASGSAEDQSSAANTPITPRTSAPIAVADQPSKQASSVALVESQNIRPDWDKPREKSPQALRATIISITKLSRGQYVLTLSVGQVWREIEPRRQSRYSVGDEIVITRAFGGSFDLKSSATGYRNKVRRVE
jgi:hypothetical protein